MGRGQRHDLCGNKTLSLNFFTSVRIIRLLLGRDEYSRPLARRGSVVEDPPPTFDSTQVKNTNRMFYNADKYCKCRCKSKCKYRNGKIDTPKYAERAEHRVLSLVALQRQTSFQKLITNFMNKSDQIFVCPLGGFRISVGGDHQ